MICTSPAEWIPPPDPCGPSTGVPTGLLVVFVLLAVMYLGGIGLALLIGKGRKRRY